jgi:hypothetical protein
MRDKRLIISRKNEKGFAHSSVSLSSSALKLHAESERVRWCILQWCVRHKGSPGQAASRNHNKKNAGEEEDAAATATAAARPRDLCNRGHNS